MSLKRRKQRRALALSSMAFSHCGKLLRMASSSRRAVCMSAGSWLISNCLACPRPFSASLRLLTHKWCCSRASEGMVGVEVELAFTHLLPQPALKRGYKDSGKRGNWERGRVTRRRREVKTEAYRGLSLCKRKSGTSACYGDGE